MTVALHDGLNKTVSSLISVDMAPSEGRISPESVRLVCARTDLMRSDRRTLTVVCNPLHRFKAYTKAMMAIEAAGVSTRAEADKLLSETEPVSRPAPVTRCAAIFRSN
jgi:hypothetical protein